MELKVVNYDHIFTSGLCKQGPYIFVELRWLPLHARIEFNILTLLFKVQWGLTLKYPVDVML